MIVTYDANYDPANIQAAPPASTRQSEAEQPNGVSKARAQNANYGKVPNYIKGIKNELAEKRERAAKAESDA